MSPQPAWPTEKHLSTNFVQFSSVQGMPRARTVPKDVHINNYDQFSSVQISAYQMMRGNLPDEQTKPPAA